MERGLIRAEGDVRAKEGKGISNEQHLAAEEGRSWGEAVGDDGHKRFSGLLQEFGQGGRQDGLAVGAFLGPDVVSHLPDRDHIGMSVAIAICHDVGQLGRMLGIIAVPDEVQQALSRLETSMVARNGISIGGGERTKSQAG